MSTLVLDASVASKLFLTEADSPGAWRLMAGSGPFFAPTIIRVEVSAAVTRQHRMNAFDEADARLKLGDIRMFVAPPVFTLISDEALLDRAGEMALEIRHPLQDCLYIACAERVRGDLVTADPKLLARAAPQFPFVRAL